MHAGIGQMFEIFKHFRMLVGVKSTATLSTGILTRAMAAQIVGSVVVWFAEPAILHDPVGEQDASLLSRLMVAIFRRLT
jgi:hypothetical protein